MLADAGANVYIHYNSSAWSRGGRPHGEAEAMGVQPAIGASNLKRSVELQPTS